MNRATLVLKGLHNADPKTVYKSLMRFIASNHPADLVIYLCDEGGIEMLGKLADFISNNISIALEIYLSCPESLGAGYELLDFGKNSGL
ncbi:hypothetical protein [Thermofilum sp.]|jgi:hypothetical protein|uniref:hypothetical protein n=1 Tax=Thermofilum sp. TaxID=1961369 RepID=UPI002584395C|nr:hypothetical protein [Thermofilum sp.]